MATPREPRPTLPLSGLPPEGERVTRPPEITPITPEDYVERYGAEGERLERGGATPSAPAAQYIAAYPGLRRFLQQHGEALSVRGVVSAEVEAGEVLVGRLEALHPEG